MEFIKLKVQCYPYKQDSEKDEMDALTKSVLKDIGRISTEDDDDELESEPIWLDMIYSKQYLADTIQWMHVGLANEDYTIMYFSQQEFVLVDMQIDKLIETLNEI
jgi:hypothetical protein